MIRIVSLGAALTAACILPVWAQDATQPTPTERWNLYYQATSIGQYHGTFNSPYEDQFSLQDYAERDVSLTSTLFLGFNLGHDTQFYFDPEIAGGRGFSSVDGLANPPNGELPRVAGATPKPYVARAYISHDFGFGDERENVESDANQLGGTRPKKRLTVIAGRFTLTDFFDNNRYTHDPRTQFMEWGVMFNGAWDYPADTRGYTWALYSEFHSESWSFRWAMAAEPSVANGGRFDRRLFRDHGNTFEAERRFSVRTHPGALRLLNFVNRTRSGSYGEALQVAAATGSRPDVTAIRRPGTLKYGFGVNAEQEITRDLGVFMRLGWADGKNEDFAFTAIDRIANAGVSLSGARWHRKGDTIATSYAASGLSAVHALYLARGGYDFLIGDGRLNYAPEYTWESYYSAQLPMGFAIAFDAQHYANPAYNHDRGPLWAYSIRIHVEGKAGTR
ncbi:MAG: carbohydrate porin [Acidobacteriota bacterium]|nr:carbohydrate porin [Acidobacteriota bacterium]